MYRFVYVKHVRTSKYCWVYIKMNDSLTSLSYQSLYTYRDNYVDYNAFLNHSICLCN